VLVPPRGVVAPCGPPAVLCAPLWWARAPCAAPPRCGFLPRVLVPPRGVVTSCGPDRDTETIAMTAERLQRWTHSFARSMETPRERPPTRLRVVCQEQEGWDGARRHPSTARSRRSVSSQQSSSAVISHSRSHRQTAPLPTLLLLVLVALKKYTYTTTLLYTTITITIFKI